MNSLIKRVSLVETIKVSRLKMSCLSHLPLPATTPVLTGTEVKHFELLKFLPEQPGYVTTGNQQQQRFQTRTATHLTEEYFIITVLCIQVNYFN